MKQKKAKCYKMTVWILATSPDKKWEREFARNNHNKIIVPTEWEEDYCDELCNRFSLSGYVYKKGKGNR